MASPSVTQTVTPILSSSTISASGSSSNLDIDLSSKFKADIQVSGTFAAGATGGLQIDKYRRIGPTPVADTVSTNPQLLTAVASTTQTMSFSLPGGTLWRLVITNTDASHSVTAVTVTSATLDAIS